uniref:SERPIN domain-containing protein n=1 Tax=Parastrongyloides trichosuri TaxID=131310 RepID=A0A0N5A1W2_PARTI
MSFEYNEMMASTQANIAVETLKSIYRKRKSFVISPASLSIALAMAFVGSEGETKEVLKRFLGEDSCMEDILKFYKNIQEKIASKSDTMFKCSNKLYLQSDMEVEKKFMDDINKYFQGQFDTIDFQNVQNTIKNINTFVSNSTNNLINNVVNVDDIDIETRLFLINVLYFKGEWLYSFDKIFTKEEIFYLNENETKMVPMMMRKGDYLYYESDKEQFIMIQYDNLDIFLAINLPKEKNNFNEYVEDFSGQRLCALIELATRQELKLYLPKFKTEYSVNLNSTLKELGMDSCLSSDADFSGISKKEKLSINKVLQKTYINISEEGTEAAAATTVKMNRCRMPVLLSQEVIFRADHSFIYHIADRNGVIYFSGIFQ